MTEKACSTCDHRLEESGEFYCRRFPPTLFERSHVLPNVPVFYSYHSQFPPVRIPCGEWVEGDGIVVQAPEAAASE